MTLGNLAGGEGLYLHNAQHMVLLVIFILVVNRLTREDQKRKDKSK